MLRDLHIKRGYYIPKGLIVRVIKCLAMMKAIYDTTQEEDDEYILDLK